MTCDIVLEDDRWKDLDLDTVVTDAVQEALAHLGLSEQAEVSLLACDDTRMAALNAAFRGKTGPTNVLSWPNTDLSAKIPGTRPRAPEADFTGGLTLGDIAIARETCLREAGETDTPLAAHVTHLVVHGLLHLLGYGHESGDDAAKMERLETEILGKLGFPDPYSTIDRGN